MSGGFSAARPKWSGWREGRKGASRKLEQKQGVFKKIFENVALFLERGKNTPGTRGTKQTFHHRLVVDFPLCRSARMGILVQAPIPASTQVKDLSFSSSPPP